MFKPKHFLKTLLLLLTLFVYSANSQELYDYTISESTGDYESISGTYLTAGDDSYTSFTMPFPFYYDNTLITSIGVNTNGWMGLNRTTTGIPSYISNYTSSIFVYSRDMYILGEVSYTVLGSQPNRVLVIQWNNMGTYTSTCRNEYRQAQVRLYETSNSAEIILGPGYSDYTGGCSVDGQAAFSGFSSGEYININPGSPSTYYKGTNGTIYYLNTDAKPYLSSAKKYKLSTYPTLLAAYPAQDSIFRRGDVLTGANHPGVKMDNVSTSFNVVVNYKVAGPLPASNPDYKVIYTATVEGNTSNEDVPITDNGITRFTEAKGIAARTNPSNDGALNLLQTLKAGTYEVIASMRLLNANFSMSLPQQTFTVALDNDLALQRVDAPIDKTRKKYPLSAGNIAITATFINQGLNPISEFTTTAVVYNSNGIEVWNKTYDWIDFNNPLKIGERATINFGSFKPSLVGDYTIVFTSTLESGRDEDLSNNRFPRGTGALTFEVAHEIEASAIDVVAPEGQVFVGKPILPRGRFQNNGVSDMADVPALMVITRMSDGQEVYRDEIIIEDLQQGKYSITTSTFGSVFIPETPGQYQACITINSPDDVVLNNNTYCETFEVVHAMAGNYTIGTKFAGGARNFNTIQDAVNNLFLKGVTGAVKFELTDPQYEVGDINNVDKAALDLRTKIIGASDKNTITFVPTKDLSGLKGNIKINLNSAKGIGIQFGQTEAPDNPYSTVHGILPSLVREYAASAGYFIFDGGLAKAFAFRLRTNSPFRAVFYLGDGASNITVKNSVITNYEKENASYACNIPNTKYAIGIGFTFEDDLRNTGAAYSSGVVLRSISPIVKKDERNTFNLDTLPNKNNVISGNEISGFGYGIVSLGIGPLYSTKTSKFEPYYNNGNEFKNNVIKDIAKAGVLVGYESNTKIENNAIFNILGGCTGFVAGIVAGGEKEGLSASYNNMNLTINANEIANLNSDEGSIGIKLEQERQQFFENQTVKYFPYANVNKITNNVIRSINVRDENAYRIGIAVTTTRKTATTPLTGEPLHTDYFTNNDVVANNTVVISSDSYNNANLTAAVLIQNANNMTFKNNAMAVLDNSTTGLTTVVAYTGLIPNSETGLGLRSDRNAFYYAGTNSSLIRFIDIDEKGKLIEAGSNSQYLNLSQWRVWTNADRNSVFGDFVKDLTVVGYNPGKYRVITSPDTPLGSILNNRGERLTDIRYDIDGTYRGEADRRYDIGADEFDGRLYVSDLEIVEINAPESYRSTSGAFNDAEYIMTEAPVEISAVIRNNGALIKQGAGVTVKVYMQAADGNFIQVPAVEEIIRANFAPAENLKVNFLLANNTGKEFVPQTYSDLRNVMPKYVVPMQFAAMEANVTPLYKIVVKVEDDEFAPNNEVVKYVRFYIKRSLIDLLVSVENASAALDNGTVTLDKVAGKLNADSLRAAMTYVGWKIDMDKGLYDYDIFDRSGWEGRAVDYTDYRSMFYADGDGDGLNRSLRIDIERFLKEGEVSGKRNLVISSEEFVRNSTEPAFTRAYLGADNMAPGNPKGAGVSNHGNSLKGVAIAKDFIFNLKETGFSNTYIVDAQPLSGLLTVVPDGGGVRRVGFVYTQHPASTVNNVAGVAVTTTAYNAATVGSDWRHFGNLEYYMRGLIDFIEKNDGHIVPVEMYSFDANARGASVVLDWATASEQNVNRFEVEKAEVTPAGINDFAKIDEAAAKGNGNITYYGPIVDNNVKMGATYAYRIRIVDNDGSWAFSDTREVTLTGANGTISVEEITPNPVAANGTLIVNLTEAMNVSIDVYDMSSAKVMTLANGSLSAGLNTFNLNAADLANGAYTVVVRSGDVTIMKKFTVIR